MRLARNVSLRTACGLVAIRSFNRKPGGELKQEQIESVLSLRERRLRWDQDRLDGWAEIVAGCLMEITKATVC